MAAEARSPSVSIVLPTHNGAAHLRESVDSCLNQTFEDLELIVVVDGSTDDTEAILSAYTDPRLRVLKQSNQGLPAALNAGFAQARARLLSWTSDDNIYLPNALAVMWDYMQAHPGSAMVCTDCLLIDDAGRTFAYERKGWGCFLYRAEAAALAGPYRTEFPLVEDVDFFLRLRHYGGPIARISRPYYKYRIHKNSLSARHTADRQFVSLRLHYDLVARGVEQLDLRELFYDRLSTAALYRDYAAMDAIVQFAHDHDEPFSGDLAHRRDVLKTSAGWLRNRIVIALRAQRTRLQNTLLLLAELVRRRTAA
ncbi:MAG: glycosyltransferase family 2 protein [Candidatus Koribacter versatilis]|uniref:Glycosyltransferase family 2 protein n=1 Tax=Candidatus Korobacter versatilis TaxID=658062 RepID=A0A932A6L1_9BACT|nr:glycosyltransferase family 2 protein [Candidatus Koribacter versatilis]